MGFLDAFFGKIFSSSVPVELAGGLNFLNGLRAVYNAVDARVDIDLDPASNERLVPVYSTGNANDVLRVDAAGGALEWTDSPTVAALSCAGTATVGAVSCSGTSTVGALDVSGNVSIDGDATIGDGATNADLGLLGVATGYSSIAFSNPAEFAASFVRQHHPTDSLQLGHNSTVHWSLDASGDWVPANGENVGSAAKPVGIVYSKALALPPESTLTIASGAITITGSSHTLLNEGAAATDTLSTINGGVDGQILLLRPSSSGQVPTLDEAGNILFTGSTVQLATSVDFVMLYFDAAYGGTGRWLVLSTSPGCVIA